MVKVSTKTLALVISAVKNLRELKGSTSKEILRYVTAVYDLPTDAARREMRTALKRGLTYGVLKKNGARYSVLADPGTECEVPRQELGLLNVACFKRRRQKIAKKHHRRDKSRRMCKCKQKRRRKRRRSHKKSRRESCRPRRRSRKRSRAARCEDPCAKPRRRRSKRRKKKCKCVATPIKQEQKKEKPQCVAERTDSTVEFSCDSNFDDEDRSQRSND